ncbi:Uncharacterized protein C25H2.10c [Grifola frondosa]|uniref:Uncharacterized protein C25H2.10c n=1 Tax=Grifola frondosa TaxID=5627 RepID=A0A1C7MBK9_GRIFR|nr:Uncharacterized protein C25H2.10c [Grifola frondosa]
MRGPAKSLAPTPLFQTTNIHNNQLKLEKKGAREGQRQEEIPPGEPPSGLFCPPRPEHAWSNTGWYAYLGTAVDRGARVWATCVKGKEKQTVGELYDLFESLASELWPENAESSRTAAEEDDGEDSDEDGDIEKQIAKEVASMKRPRKEQRFANCQTNTPCVVFISCKPPVDPAQLIVKHVHNVMDTGVTQTRYTQRLTPVSGTCAANLPEIQSLCTRILSPVLAAEPKKKFSYKIELRMRNHSTLARNKIIDEIAKCVPEGHKVDLANPELFILVEVFKNTCGISVVKDYYRLQKFNVMEIANAKNLEEDGEEGRVTEKPKSEAVTPVIVEQTSSTA